MQIRNTSFINKFNRANLTLSAVFLCLFGAAMIAFGIFMVKEPNTKTEKTTGTITELVEYYDWVGDEYQKVHKVFVSYKANDGVYYEDLEYGSYTIGMKEGDKVDIEYDPDDPTNISSPAGKFMPYIVLVIGAAVVFFGIMEARKAAMIKKAEQEGELNGGNYVIDSKTGSMGYFPGNEETVWTNDQQTPEIK